jgi:hypothetical protein
MAKMFRQTTRMMMIVIQTATLICAAPSQYAITIEAAEISAQRVMDEAYQFYSWSDYGGGKFFKRMGDWMEEEEHERRRATKRYVSLHSSQQRIRGHRHNSEHRIEEWNRVEEAMSPFHPSTASLRRQLHQ